MRRGVEKGRIEDSIFGKGPKLLWHMTEYGMLVMMICRYELLIGPSLSCDIKIWGPFPLNTLRYK